LSLSKSCRIETRWIEFIEIKSAGVLKIARFGFDTPFRSASGLLNRRSLRQMLKSTALRRGAEKIRREEFRISDFAISDLGGGEVKKLRQF
jgi:hypothetical protein